MTAEVREIGNPHRRDELVAMLRRVADDMESGNTAPPQELVVVWSAETGEVRMSTSGDDLALLGLMSAAQMQIMREQQD